MTRRTLLGAAVASDAVRLVATRQGRILWAAEAPSSGNGAGEALAELLVAKRAPRWFAAGIAVAVGPTYSQVKRVSGLPALRNPLELSKVVQRGTSRFFVHRGVPLVATGVELARQGALLAGVIDEPMMNEICEALARRRVRVRAIMPTIAALPSVFQDGRVLWRDGEVTADLMVVDRRLASVRCLPSAYAQRQEPGPGSEAPSPALPLVPLSALGEGGVRFADAYAAAVGSLSTPLVVDMRARRQRMQTITSLRIAVAGVTATLGLAAALVMPGIRAQNDAAAVRAELQAKAPLLRRAATQEATLRRTSDALHQLIAFAGARRSHVLFLGSLAEALSPDAMVVSMRLDSLGGTFIALAPRAADVLSSLEKIPFVDAPEIVGPVTPERIASVTRERFTVRFRWQGATR
jgi:hypothetical protein